MLRLAICANASGSKPSQIPVVLAAGTLVLPDRRSNLPELDSLSALVALYGGRTFLKVVFCGSHKTGDVVRVGQSCGWLCHNMKQERGGLGSRSFRQYSVCGRYFNICEQWRNFDPSSPNFRPSGHVSMGSTDAESSNGRMRRSERLHVGSIPASAASQMEVIRPDEEPVLKTGGGQQPLVGSSPTASASGSWSNRTTLAPQARNPGASPGDSTRMAQPRGPTATTLGPHPGNDGSTPSGAT